MRSFPIVQRWRIVIALGLVGAVLIGSGPTRASAPTCQSVPITNPAPNILSGVAASSSRDAWAVGFSSTQGTFALHCG